MKQRFDIYTDGACFGRGQHKGLGAYAAVILTVDRADTVLQTEQAVDSTDGITNIQAEIKACLLGFKLLPPGNHIIRVFTDSAVVVRTMTNQKTSRRSYRKLWTELSYSAANHQVEWVKVGAHGKETDDRHRHYNELADTLARATKEQAREASYV